jgi:hypothetical protein
MKMSALRQLPIFWRASIAGIAGAAFGLALAVSGLGLWGFVAAGAVIAPFMVFIDPPPRPKPAAPASDVGLIAPSTDRPASANAGVHARVRPASGDRWSTRALSAASRRSAPA